jgi:uncharacterized protein (TIGR00251 family)
MAISHRTHTQPRPARSPRSAAAAPALGAALPVWARLRADGCGYVLSVHVQPNARASAVTGRHGDALKLRIAAPAVDDKANAALVEFLASALGVPRAAIRITQGSSARRKCVEIAEVSPTLAARLGAWDREAQ